MAKGDGSGSSRTSDDTIWIIAGIMVVFVGLLFLFSKYYWLFNAIYGSVAWIHVYPVAMLGEAIPFLQSVPLLGTLLIGPCVAVNDFLASGGFSEMTFEGTSSARGYVMSAAGRVAFLIYSPFLVRAALMETEVYVDQKYKKKHSLESMLKEQAKSFPTIRMFKHVNPIETRDLMPRDFAEGAIRQMSAMKGPAGDLITGTKVMLRPSGFTRSINPEEWLVSNGLVMDRERFDKLTSGLFPANDREFYFDHEWERITIASISEVLEGQLTTPWTSPEALTLPLRALFAAMTMFYGYDLNGGNRLFDDLGMLAERGAIEKKSMADMIAADEGVMKKISAAIESSEGKQMAQIATGHAWVESALPTLLRRARFERGVVASASFIWLKQEDRAAWYILNATGNDAVNVEACGAMAHNRAELDFKSPLAVPHVYQAARSILHDYLDCHPARIETRRFQREQHRTMDEQIRLMSQDVRGALGAEEEQELLPGSQERLSITYEEA